MIEIWKEVPGFPMYEASTLGRVRSWRVWGGNYNGERRSKKSRVLKPGMRSRYLGVVLWEDRKPKSMDVHRLVLETFHGAPPDGMICCHNDGNSLNNRLENLRWGTYKDNTGDTIAHGRTTRGEKNSRSKLTESQVLEIREDNRSGNEIAEHYGIARGTVYGIKQRRAWCWLD